MNSKREPYIQNPHLRPQNTEFPALVSEWSSFIC